MSTILTRLPLLIAVMGLILFSMITAYVMKFGVRNSGIRFDYFLFTLYIVAALVLGKAI